ncbi:MAG: hypothetical protein WC516_06320 [Patescibacteria group bacterium]|jgi:hypothetical protein
MKLTNALLIILICIISFQKFPRKVERAVSDGVTVVKVGSQEYKTVKATSEEKKDVKHSTTFRSYVDSDSRTTQGVSHNIRVGKDYYVSGGVTTRQSSYGQNSVGADISLTRYW